MGRFPKYFVRKGCIVHKCPKCSKIIDIHKIVCDKCKWQIKFNALVAKLKGYIRVK